MNYFETLSPNTAVRTVTLRRIWRCALLLLVAAGLSACGIKEGKPGQALARVNGEEITVLQINDELSRAVVKSEQQEAASKQALESLIDRQLILEEAMRNKIHRTPEVIQAIERAKAKIVAQAYIDRVASEIPKPTMSEISDYFNRHPQYFTERKQLVIQQLIIPTADVRDELKSFMDTANSLNEVASWMDRHSVRYMRGQLSRTSGELPEQIAAKLKELQKGQLFIVTEGENSLLNSISEVRDSPVTLKNAVPLIEQYLINKKSREAEAAEVAHLRSLSKIEYLTAQEPLAH